MNAHDTRPRTYALRDAAGTIHAVAATLGTILAQARPGLVLVSVPHVADIRRLVTQRATAQEICHV